MRRELGFKNWKFLRFWTQISIPPLQVRGALSGGWGGMLMSVGVESSHWQIAKRLRSWASSEVDCECPLYPPWAFRGIDLFVWKIYSNFFVFIVDKPVDPWYYIGGSKNTVNVFAALAQLVERRLGKAEVGSSNLLGSLNHEAFRNIREAFFVLQEIPVTKKTWTRQWGALTQDARADRSKCLLWRKSSSNKKGLRNSSPQVFLS